MMTTDKVTYKNWNSSNQDDQVDENLPLELTGSRKSYNNNNNKNDININISSSHQNDTGDNGDKKNTINVASIIGEFGFYQLSLTIFTLFRYTLTAMMTNAGPLLAPDAKFWCQIPKELNDSIAIPKNLTRMDYLASKCQVQLVNGSQFECKSWTYDTTGTGITLTDTFNLVCDRDWLRSAFQSMVSIGIVFAAVIWGSISDRHGRKLTLWICFVWTLIASFVSFMAEDLIVFAIARCLSTFGDLGTVTSLSTLIVETLGNKYRGPIGLIVYTGWAFGVMLMPWLVDYYLNFRHSMLFLMACHLLSLPWLLTLGESIRWSLVNGFPDEAHREVRRICRFNCSGDQDSLHMVDTQFNKLKEKFVLAGRRQKAYRENVESKMSWPTFILMSLFGGMSKVGEIFKSRVLAITATTIIWTTFTSELLYMLFVLMNSDIGEDTKLNYAIGGIMETLATILSIIMVSILSRKLSLVSTLVSLSGLCCTLAYTHHNASISVWVLNLTKLSVSTLTSLVYVTTTEIYPTNLRQTGFGLSSTVGSMGAVVAPFIRHELTNLIGMTRVMQILMILPLSAAIVIIFNLRETKGVELPDEVDELETETSFMSASGRRDSRLSSLSWKN